MAKIGNIDLGKFPIILAPMEDVSDPPFRVLCKEQGADLVFSEFISAEGLIRNAQKSTKKLDIYKEERPIGIQVFGSDLDSMIQATKIIEQTDPDIIDINYGCPVKNVVNKGAGSSLLRDIPKMVKITQDIVKSTNKPITVKTRLGWDEDSINIVEVAERLQDIGIKAITIHGRTRKQMFKGSANWEKIAEVKNNHRMYIPVFGNGDINTPQNAKDIRDKYGLDGVMIGRASIGNPWIFKQVKNFLNGIDTIDITINERVEMIKKHLLKAIEWKGERKAISQTRYHYKSYLKDIEYIKPLKLKLIHANSLDEIFYVFDEIGKQISLNVL